MDSMDGLIYLMWAGDHKDIAMSTVAQNLKRLKLDGKDVNGAIDRYVKKYEAMIKELKNLKTR